MEYPIWDLAMSRGVLVGVVAIAHVIVAHFAVGGGLVIAVTETLSVRREDPALRDLAKRSSLMLILVSTVFGAISGVGIWVVVGLVSPSAISALIQNYVWGWSIEWVFFIVEIVAALVYYATWGKISKRAHLMVGWLYFVSAYLSLVIINGIITFMLTPGRWLETRSFWDGFFNPTYWPSLALRTGIVLLMATAFMAFTALRLTPEHRPRVTRYLGAWLTVGALLSYGGYRWWEGALPESVQALFLGSSPALQALAQTRSFLLWSLTAALVLGLMFMVALPRMMHVVPALLIAVTAFSFFGGYERLREGVRKPYLIHDYMFSNGIRTEDIEAINDEGLLSRARWAAWPPAEDKATLGRQVFLAQCSSCHTLDGYLALRPMLPDDPDMIVGVLFGMYEMGEAYVSLDPGQTVDKTDLDYAYMPPFVGSMEELEALAEYLTTLTSAGTQIAEKEVSP